MTWERLTYRYLVFFSQFSAILRPTVDSNRPHQRAKTVVTASFAQSLTDLPRNYARAKIGLDTYADIFETGT